MKTVYWLIKREFWEHRGGFFWAPVITGGVFLLLNIMGIIGGEVFGVHHGFHFGDAGDLENLPRLINSLDAHQMQMVGSGLDMAMLSASFLISIVFCFVVFFYCLGALYDDRRDRSILFWKSLPISNTQTVASKVIAAIIAAPIIAIACGVLTGFAMLLLFAITLSLHGVSVWSLLMLAHPLQVISFLIGSLPIYMLWSLPTVGWLMLCSSWARSKPFLWAVVIPVALGVILSWFHILGLLDVRSDWYWREILARVLFSVFPGGWFKDTGLVQIGHDPQAISDFFSLSNAYSVLAKPDIWIGAVAGVAMLALSVWFRRWRDDS
ncbi:ABC-2 transporter permease [Dyella caseinilytica]|uniref:ABC-2 transporter permease n=1 Tax=Dyella caseinilytica TaxID=1849581 RepID=A0ABX7GXT8_9GAMM|nr:ABC-2 transporter permease [Dyella caseinilytica]QRN55109.1 ABC-2 transporter permease [Dyella caseinilytica]GFZ99426.1 ABC transporter permease [Dyella caseinilytica]